MGLRERCDQFIIAALLGPHALGGYVLVLPPFGLANLVCIGLAALHYRQRAPAIS